MTQSQIQGTAINTSAIGEKTLPGVKQERDICNWVNGHDHEERGQTILIMEQSNEALLRQRGWSIPSEATDDASCLVSIAGGGDDDDDDDDDRKMTKAQETQLYLEQLDVAVAATTRSRDDGLSVPIAKTLTSTMATTTKSTTTNAMRGRSASHDSSQASSLSLYGDLETDFQDLGTAADASESAQPETSEAASFNGKKRSRFKEDEDGDDNQNVRAQSSTSTYATNNVDSDRNPKQRRLNNHKDNSSTSRHSPNDIRELARTRLSKWAARLFDPDRPKGLIQPPQTIPLNDEFLQAFGKREKEHDLSTGVDFAIDRSIRDENDDDNDDYNHHDRIGEGEGVTDSPLVTNDMSKMKKSKTELGGEGSKIKIANLKYTTTSKSIELACSRFGSVENVNLIMDRESVTSEILPLSIGRAYVTFESAESAELCKQQLTELEGRPLRISMVHEDAAVASSFGGGGVAGSNNAASSMQSRSNRYWMQDLRTKCFRCGQVGHREAGCTNEPAAKPCPMCAETTHDLRSCPIRVVCFQCGLPGHVARECRLNNSTNHRLGRHPNDPLPASQRIVCTICYQVGHHKRHCRVPSLPMQDPARLTVLDYAKAAVCMSCGRLGHYTCRPLHWFFGLDGVYCAQCGASGHLAPHCARPGLDTCSKNENLVAQEVQRAYLDSILRSSSSSSRRLDDAEDSNPSRVGPSRSNPRPPGGDEQDTGRWSRGRQLQSVPPQPLAQRERVSRSTTQSPPPSFISGAPPRAQSMPPPARRNRRDWSDGVVHSNINNNGRSLSGGSGNNTNNKPSRQQQQQQQGGGRVEFSATSAMDQGLSAPRRDQSSSSFRRR